MAHPLFEAYHYPFNRPEASELHERLYRSVPSPKQIDWFYRNCGEGLPPLNLTAAPPTIWRDALENLTSAHRMQIFCERVLTEDSLAAMHGFVEQLLRESSTKTVEERYSELVDLKHTSGLTVQEQREMDDAFGSLSKDDEAVYGPIFDDLLKRVKLKER